MLALPIHLLIYMKKQAYSTGTEYKIPALPGNEIAIGILADLHCGHVLGLSSPDYFRPLDAEDPDICLLAKKQREFWGAYTDLIRQAGPVNHLLVQGDSVDGDGFRLEGAETICQTPDEQASLAASCIKKWVTPGVTQSVHMIGGTPSHTWFGPLDMEKMVKDHVITKCPKVSYDQSCITEFSLPGASRPFRILQRHDTPKGGIQTGGAGPGAIRQSIRFDLEMLYNGYLDLRPDLLVFSHAHEAFFGMLPLAGHNKYIIVTPCLQGSGSVYGRTKCTGTITWGLTVLNLKVVRGEIHFSHRFFTRTLTANRPVVNRVTYGTHA